MDERPEISRAAFDRYVERHGIPPEHYPAALALWLTEATGGGPVQAFEKVEPQPPADGVVIEGDEVAPALAKLSQ